MLIIVWTLLFQRPTVRTAGYSLSPAAMRIMTLLLLDGKPGKKLEKTAKERIQIWLLHILLLKR